MVQDAQFCPSCGEPVEPNARFCGNCRHEVNPPAAPALPPDQRLAQPSDPGPAPEQSQQPPIVILPEQPEPDPQPPVVHAQPIAPQQTIHIHQAPQAPSQPVVQQVPVAQAAPAAPAFPRSFVGSAFLCWLLYGIGCWIVGFITNIVYIGQANQERARTGRGAPGAGCLWFVLVFNIVMPIIATIAIILLGGISAVLQEAGINYNY